jgi:hypothetical protein
VDTGSSNDFNFPPGQKSVGTQGSEQNIAVVALFQTIVSEIKHANVGYETNIREAVLGDLSEHRLTIVVAVV